MEDEREKGREVEKWEEDGGRVIEWRKGHCMKFIEHNITPTK